MAESKQLGIAVVGSGRIGSLRATLAARHPSVRFVAVSDQDADRAAALAKGIGAQVHSGNNREIIAHPDVSAVVVSTSEHQHLEAVLQALELGKPVLVEKPIALRLEDADQMLAAAERSGAELLVGYVQRFKRSYMLAKEQIAAGRLGRLIAASVRTALTRQQAMEIVRRSATITPVLDVLTYWVDMLGWFAEGNRAVDVVARANGIVFKEQGHAINDVTWALVTFADGMVANFGVSVALPANHPTLGQHARLEVYGTDGVIEMNDEHDSEVIYTDKGIPHPYVPGHTINMAYLGSTAAGDWAQGSYWGPVGEETRAWLDHLATGQSCAITTAPEARQTLEITLAIEESLRTGESVKLPLRVGQAKDALPEGFAVLG